MCVCTDSTDNELFRLLTKLFPVGDICIAVLYCLEAKDLPYLPIELEFGITPYVDSPVVTSIVPKAMPRWSDEPPSTETQRVIPSPPLLATVDTVYNVIVRRVFNEQHSEWSLWWDCLFAITPGIHYIIELPTFIPLTLSSY